jgi:riboflavin kinase/FMN adenylyltransferase
VVRGDGRGKTIGYPTANIGVDSPVKQWPARGVYMVGVRLGGVERFGMLNIGLRPTVSDGRAETMEVNIFDFDREIYGERIGVSFLKRLREEVKFGSVEELARQLARDKEESLRYIAGNVNKS